LVKLYKDSLVRAIGVSNFQIHHLKDVMAAIDIFPMANQVEYHPLLSQKELLNFCQSQKIQLEAYSPLMRGQLLNDLVLIELGRKYKKLQLRLSCAGIFNMGLLLFPSRQIKIGSLRMPVSSVSSLRRKT